MRVGICGELLRLFSDYLDAHTQHVSVNDSSLPSRYVTSDVRSILGPLLFMLAMDPLTSIPISNSGIICIYADDICKYKPVFSTTDLLSLQHDINSMQPKQKKYS